MNRWLTTLVLLIECPILLVIFARGIGWKPRWRWQAELKQRELQWRIEGLELRIGELKSRIRDLERGRVSYLTRS